LCSRISAPVLHSECLEVKSRRKTVCPDWWLQLFYLVGSGKSRCGDGTLNWVKRTWRN